MGNRNASFADDGGLVVVRAEVESVRVVGGDFFSIADMRRASGDGERFTAVGSLLGVKVGSALELHGTWVTHPKHGRQLKVKTFEELLSQDTAGIVRWIAERLPGIGRARATALVEHFGGAAIWSVIEETPERLAEVHGISAHMVGAIAAAYAQHRAERKRMVWFKGLGLTDTQIARIVQRWGDEAEQHLRDNPYDLADEVFGFGFRRADEIALRMGLPGDSPARLRAGVLFTLGEARGQGHVFVRGGTLVGIAAGNLGNVEERLVWLQLYALVKERRLVRHGNDEQPGMWRVYRADLDAAEARVAKFIRSAA